MKKKIISVFFIFSVVCHFLSAQIKSDIDFNKFYSIEAYNLLEGTIFDVFSKDLKQYDTDLKKRVFLQSDDAKPYIQKMNELKTQMLNTDVTNIIRNNWDEIELSDYDVNNGGFWLTIGRNNGQGYASGTYKFAINGFAYDKLPVRELTYDMLPKNMVSYRIFLKVPEVKAIEIEGNRNIEIRLVTRVIGAKKIDFRFHFWNGESGTVTGKHAIVNKMKIILYDKKQEKVLLEANF